MVAPQVFRENNRYEIQISWALNARHRLPGFAARCRPSDFCFDLPLMSDIQGMALFLPHVVDRTGTQPLRETIVFWRMLNNLKNVLYRQSAVGSFHGHPWAPFSMISFSPCSLHPKMIESRCWEVRKTTRLDLPMDGRNCTNSSKKLHY